MIKKILLLIVLLPLGAVALAAQVIVSSGGNVSAASLSGIVAFANGGLGFNTATAGDIFYASATNTPGKLADVAVGQVLVSGGVGVVPAYSANPTVTTITTGFGAAATPSVIVGVAGYGLFSNTSSVFTCLSANSVSIACADQNSTAFRGASHNTFDIGRTDVRWRTGYFATRLQTPVISLDAAGASSGTGTLLISSTAPTVTSAGTSPSVPSNNGTVTFRVNVGTGGTATTIVMAMPTAITGWNCTAENITSNAANRANQRVVFQSSTTTAVTVQNQTISTGAALAFTASDIVSFTCHGF